MPERIEELRNKQGDKINKISESIFSGKSGVDTFVIPLAKVQYVRKEEWGHNIGIGKIRTEYNVQLEKTMVILPHHLGKSFMEAWCYYRHEIEGGKEAFKSPSD